MCIGGGGSIPAPPPLPAPIPPVRDSFTAEKLSQARGRARRQAALAKGRTSTILTSGLGLTTTAKTAAPTALGRIA